MVAQVTVSGVTDTGRIPGSGGGRDTAIRQISSQDPNYGTDNPALNCGPNAKPAAKVLSANPGDTMSFKWTTADPNQTWRHNTGPIITYLANCGSQSCAEFDSSNARFFKIKQDGVKSNGQWVQGDLMNGALATATLPSTLAPGNYLVRHEIISLHLANEAPRKAEFYPSCIQIKVGGSGTGRPLDNELVTFPGAYNDNDKGLFGFSADNYQFPGPAIAAFVNGGPSGAGGNADTGASSSRPKGASSTAATGAPKSTNTAGATPANNGSAVSAQPKQGCRVARRSAKASLFPRHYSRVMRRAIDSGSFERAASQ
jgi:hypothetical protein